jgi:hypothetical protein
MEEEKLFDGDMDFRRVIELERLREEQLRRARGIDQQIAESIDRGDFDNLPGKGQPLRWDSPIDDDNWLANHVLKNAGVTPAWIEDAKHIQAERKALAESLREIERWQRSAQADVAARVGSVNASKSDELEAGLQSRIAAWRERAEKLNRVIDRYNLEVPLRERQVMRVRIEEDLADVL